MYIMKERCIGATDKAENIVITKKSCKRRHGLDITVYLNLYC